MNFFPLISRKLQLNFTNQLRTFTYRRVKKGCECPEVKDESVVVEKSCKPCSFRTWTPKNTRRLKAEIAQNQCRKEPPECNPGMVIKRPHSECKKKSIDPFKKKVCLDPVKKKPPPPKKGIHVQGPIPVPKPDWETN